METSTKLSIKSYLLTASMENRYQYRLTDIRKREIAQNLIDILDIDANLSKHTKRFIGDWILTDYKNKRKAFFDVWDIVLKNFLPRSRPLLFRSCNRICTNGKIASFTGRLECARRFSNGKGSLIICDTKETLGFEDSFNCPGDYNHTFYPLVDVLVKAKNSGGWGFSEKLLDYIGEDEHIMRIDLKQMHCVKWINNSVETTRIPAFNNGLPKAKQKFIY
jgi:hypothetical protein